MMGSESVVWSGRYSKVLFRGPVNTDCRGCPTALIATLPEAEGQKSVEKCLRVPDGTQWYSAWSGAEESQRALECARRNSREW